MRTNKYVILAGIVILGFGLVFHFQGEGVIGPETSFMYSNPDWIRNGVLIVIIGIGIIGIGISMKIIKKVSK